MGSDLGVGATGLKKRTWVRDTNMKAVRAQWADTLSLVEDKELETDLTYDRQLLLNQKHGKVIHVR